MSLFLAFALVVLLPLLATPSPSFGQAPPVSAAGVTGYVESVGFDQTYRPGCWTPMVVRVTPPGGLGSGGGNGAAPAGASGSYQLRIEQEDLDKDIVSYIRPIALTAGQEGRFVIYFLPQGTRTPASLGLSTNLEDLNSQLKVWVCDAQGQKLTKLPVRSALASVDPTSAGAGRMSTKLILYVRDPATGSSLSVREFAQNIAIQGLTEDLAFIPVMANMLPTSSLGYEGVDAVIWGAGGPPDVTNRGEAGQYRALREWVAGGGRLMVMQSGEWRRTAAWGDMLPVTFPRRGEQQGTINRADVDNLREIADIDDPAVRRSWTVLRGPFTYGLADALPGAVVEREMVWPDKTKSVYLARMGVGAGCVTYVAQDLGSRLLQPGAAPPGWAKIWCRLLDYKYAPLILTKDTPEDIRRPFRRSDRTRELGRSVLSHMELTSRVGVLISVSIVFFIIYWLVAGPGLWFGLRMKGKREWSWVGFAAAALGATVVTALVVRLLLRGDPELRHITVVRVAPNEPVLVQSRMGLYIPRDGDVDVELPLGTTDTAAAIAPYALHPFHVGDSEEFPSYRRYDVGMSDVTTDEPAHVVIPFRSTLKRLESTWHGTLPSGPIGVSGKIALTPPNSLSQLSGIISNDSGKDLINVYMAFNRVRGNQAGKDTLLYIPVWKNGEQLKLDDLTHLRNGATRLFQDDVPGRNKAIIGDFALPGREVRDFDAWFFANMRSSALGQSVNWFDDSDVSAGGGAPRVWPVLSFFDRIPTMRSTSNSEDRSELMRINARFFDCSAALSAGRLVVIGETIDAKLPAPIKVAGDPVTGSGTIIYQFIVPLDRTNDIDPPEEDDTTRPSTKPAVTPAGAPSTPAEPAPLIPVG